jgi:large subunit ribosomal protein L18
MYAQLVDDAAGKTLFSATSYTKGKVNNNIESAKSVGLAIADKAKAAGITKVVFDRNGYLYHGRIKSLAEGAREGGLQF